MTSIRTYVTILLQDLLAWLHQKLSRWLLGDVNARLRKLEIMHNHVVEALERITELENQLGVNLGGIATAFARDNERLCALEAQPRVNPDAIASVLVRVHERLDALEQAPAKAAMEAAVAPVAPRKTVSMRKPAKR
jgi:hypothetical protein